MPGKKNYHTNFNALNTLNRNSQILSILRIALAVRARSATSSAYAKAPTNTLRM